MTLSSYDCSCCQLTCITVFFYAAEAGLCLQHCLQLTEQRCSAAADAALLTCICNAAVQLVPMQLHIKRDTVLATDKSQQGNTNSPLNSDASTLSSSLVAMSTVMSPACTGSVVNHMHICCPGVRTVQHHRMADINISKRPQVLHELSNNNRQLSFSIELSIVLDLTVGVAWLLMRKGFDVLDVMLHAWRTYLLDM
jgi:hypothetical protein